MNAPFEIRPQAHVRSICSLCSTFLVALLAVGVSLVNARSAEAPSSSLPRPTGAYRTIGYAETTWTDSKRSDPQGPNAGLARQVVVRFWYPSDPQQHEFALQKPYLSPERAKVLQRNPENQAAGQLGSLLSTHASLGTQMNPNGPFPVVVFSPGFGMGAELYQNFFEEFASRGFVVAAVDHPLISDYLEIRGKVIKPVALTQSNGPALSRMVTDDLAFVVRGIISDEALPLPMNRRQLDLSRIGVAGHSFGGAAALQVSHESPFVRVAADLDGSLWLRDYTKGLETNALFLVGSDGAAANRDLQIAWRRLKGEAIFAELSGLSHLGFSDLPLILNRLGIPLEELGTGKQGLARLRLAREVLTRYFASRLQNHSQDRFRRIIEAAKESQCLSITVRRGR